jgi:hypothetical protein
MLQAGRNERDYGDWDNLPVHAVGRLGTMDRDWHNLNSPDGRYDANPA